MAHWYQQTALRRWLPLSRQQLRSQRFWDAMNAVDEQAIRKIETALSQKLVEEFGIDVRCLCFDCTNFDTFIDSRTTSELAQRGHAKSKRTDLRVVGLALLVSTDFHIPLFSRVYPGNQPDSVTFGSVTEELIERYRLLAKNLEHVTLVFDKGNNSEENLEALVPSRYHVVGSLVPTQHQDLLAVPLDRFQSFEDPRLEGVTAFRTSKKVFGREWTIVEIILAYRSQYHVEAAFRTMKNPHFVGWEPMYHWTDQKIRVHALYCVIALTLAGLLQREAHRAGLELSLEALGRELSSICEVINLYAPISGKAGRFRAATTYTEPTPTSSRLAEIFRLDDCKAR